MAVRNTVWSIDFLTKEIDAVRAEAKKRYGNSASRQTIEECCLEQVPADWRVLLKSARARLWSPPSGHSSRTSINSVWHGWERDPVSVQLATRATTVLAYRIDALGKSDLATDLQSKIKDALAAWPTSRALARAEVVRLDGQRCERWLQEFAIVALIGCRTPVAVCRMCVSALFPCVRGQGPANKRIPQVRVEVLNHVGVENDGRIEGAIRSAIKAITYGALTGVSFSLSDAEEVLFGRDYQQQEWPLALTFGWVRGMEPIAESLHAVFAENERNTGLLGYLDNLRDEGVHLTKVESVYDSDLLQPLVPKKDSRRGNSPAPDAPGHTFLLMEFTLKSIKLGTDRRLYRSQQMDRAAEFAAEFGNSANALFIDAGVDFETIAALQDYDMAKKALDNVAKDLDLESEDVRTAAYVCGVPQVGKHQPHFRALRDLATGVQYAELVVGREPISKFLDRATSRGGCSALGRTPQNLKVPKSMLRIHKEIEGWAMTRKIQIRHPTTGFDAGAMYVKRWNEVVGALVDTDRHWWTGAKQSCTPDEMRSRLVKLLEIVHNGSREWHPDYCSALLRGAPVASEKFAAWRDSLGAEAGDTGSTD